MGWTLKEEAARRHAEFTVVSTEVVNGSCVVARDLA
jgi:hypothetical protein